MFLRLLKIIVFFFVGFSLFYVSILGLSPSDFTPGTEVTFEKGESVSHLASKLKEQNIIRSPFLFRVIIKLSGEETKIQSGTYLFEKSTTVVSVAKRFISKDYGISVAKMVVPEGYTTKEISELCSSVLKNCNKDRFLSLAQDYNGELFPDTYFFFETDNEEVVIEKMLENFENKTSDIFSQMTKEEKDEILIIASILESETNEGEERYIVSGILRNRLDIGMPLQIDAPFYVYLGKKSSELTIEDLSIDEKWNTYVYKGLPYEPLGNPGMSSIDAAINPKDSPYLYYLHDENGQIYYGKTFEDHKRNKNLYLN